MEQESSSSESESPESAESDLGGWQGVANVFCCF